MSNTAMHIYSANMLTIAYAFSVDSFALFIFFLCVALRLVRFSLGLIALLLLRRIVPHFLFNIGAVTLTIYQAVLFTRHWVYLNSAMYGAARKAAARRHLGSKLALQFAFFPVSCLVGLCFVLADPQRAGNAWVSYLNYGAEGLRQPGAFHSPSGCQAFRVHLFYMTAGATILAGVDAPLPVFAMLGPDWIVVLLIILLLPVPVSMLIPSSILAPHTRSKP